MSHSKLSIVSLTKKHTVGTHEDRFLQINIYTKLVSLHVYINVYTCIHVYIYKITCIYIK